jgi:hypothetical protein
MQVLLTSSSGAPAAAARAPCERVGEAATRGEEQLAGGTGSLAGHRRRGGVAVGTGDPADRGGVRPQLLLDRRRHRAGAAQHHQGSRSQPGQLGGRGSRQRVAADEEHGRSGAARGGRTGQRVRVVGTGGDVDDRDADREDRLGQQGRRLEAAGAGEPLHRQSGDGQLVGRRSGHRTGPAEQQDPLRGEPGQLGEDDGWHAVARGQQHRTAQPCGGRTAGERVREVGPGRQHDGRRTGRVAGLRHRHRGAVAVRSGQPPDVRTGDGRPARRDQQGQQDRQARQAREGPQPAAGRSGGERGEGADGASVRGGHGGILRHPSRRRSQVGLSGRRVTRSRRLQVSPAGLRRPRPGCGR